MVEDVKHGEYKLFVDAQAYESEKSALSGLEIKNIASVPPNYQLYLEEEGDTPARHDDAFRTEERSIHFGSPRAGTGRDFF